MYNNQFFMPGYSRIMASPNIIRGLPSAAMANTARTSGGLLSRILPGLSGIRKVNWGTLINNTSRTLGLINQTIPIVRQVGPMVNNMRSMLRVASIFKDETDVKTNNNANKNTTNIKTAHNKQIRTNSKEYQSTNTKNEYTEEYNESPTFFINN